MKRLDRIPPKYRKQVENRLLKIPNAIKKRREELKLTQEELAEGLDISIETLKALEGGRRVSSLAMILYICLYLGLDMRIER